MKDSPCIPVSGQRWHHEIKTKQHHTCTYVKLLPNPHEEIRNPSTFPGSPTYPRLLPPPGLPCLKWKCLGRGSIMATYVVMDTKVVLDEWLHQNTELNISMAEQFSLDALQHTSSANQTRPTCWKQDKSRPSFISHNVTITTLSAQLKVYKGNRSLSHGSQTTTLYCVCLF